MRTREPPISIVDESAKKPEDEVVHDQKPEENPENKPENTLENKPENTLENKPEEGENLVLVEENAEEPGNEGLAPEELKEEVQHEVSEKKVTDLNFNFTVLNEHIVKDVIFPLF